MADIDNSTKVNKYVVSGTLARFLTKIKAWVLGLIDDNNSSTSTLYSSAKIDSLVGNRMKYQGEVATKADLPTTNLAIGDTYYVEAFRESYVWTGSEWRPLSAGIFVGTQEQYDQVKNQLPDGTLVYITDDPEDDEPLTVDWINITGKITDNTALTDRIYSLIAAAANDSTYAVTNEEIDAMDWK